MPIYLDWEVDPEKRPNVQVTPTNRNSSAARKLPSYFKGPSICMPLYVVYISKLDQWIISRDVVTSGVIIIIIIIHACMQERERITHSISGQLHTHMQGSLNSKPAKFKNFNHKLFTDHTSMSAKAED